MAGPEPPCRTGAIKKVGWRIAAAYKTYRVQKALFVKRSYHRLLAARAMADDGNLGAAAAEADEDAAVSDPEEGLPAGLQISKVTCVRRGQVMWLPETSEHAGLEFVRLSKWDRALCKLILGESLNLHKARERRDLNRKWFSDMMNLRCSSYTVDELDLECYVKKLPIH